MLESYPPTNIISAISQQSIHKHLSILKYVKTNQIMKTAKSTCWSKKINAKDDGVSVPSNDGEVHIRITRTLMLQFLLGGQRSFTLLIAADELAIQNDSAILRYQTWSPWYE